MLHLALPIPPGNMLCFLAQPLQDAEEQQVLGAPVAQAAPEAPGTVGVRVQRLPMPLLSRKALAALDCGVVKEDTDPDGLSRALLASVSGQAVHHTQCLSSCSACHLCAPGHT